MANNKSFMDLHELRDNPSMASLVLDQQMKLMECFRLANDLGDVKIIFHFGASMYTGVVLLDRMGFSFEDLIDLKAILYSETYRRAGN